MATISRCAADRRCKHHVCGAQHDEPVNPSMLQLGGGQAERGKLATRMAGLPLMQVSRRVIVFGLFF